MPIDLDRFDARLPPPIFTGPDAQFSFHRTFSPIRSKDYVVDRLLAKGEVSCWFGEPGATKSALALDIACHVAGGLTWMGRGAGSYIPPHNFAGERYEGWWAPASVLYVALERGAQVQRRIEAFSEEHSLKKPLEIAVWEGPLDFVSDDSDRLTQIVALAEEASCKVQHPNEEDGFMIDLVVIDTLARTFGSGSDSGGEETAKVARHLERTLKFTGAHIMLVHHTPIGDDSRLRGHGNLLAAFDMTVRVQKKASGSLASVQKDNDTAEAEKPTFAYQLKSRVVHIDPEDGRETTAPVVVPADEQVAARLKRQAVQSAQKVTPPPQPTASQKPAYDALFTLAEPVTEDIWRKAYDDGREADVTPANHRVRFMRSKKDLSAKGLITQDASGLWSVTASTSVT